MMDPEYIAMCEASPEIREGHELGQYDMFYGYEDSLNQPTEEPDIHTYDECEDTFYSVTPTEGTKAAWLPRQEDLQEMLGDFGHQKDRFGVLFTPHLPEPSKRWFPYWSKFTSWEQLWLAFVMIELYGKIWNNGQWESKQ